MGKPRSSSQAKVAEKRLVREVQTTPPTGPHNFFVPRCSFTHRLLRSHWLLPVWSYLDL